MVAKVRRHTAKYFLDAIVMMTMTKSTDDDGDDYHDKVNDVMMATKVVLTKLLMLLVKTVSYTHLTLPTIYSV